MSSKTLTTLPPSSSKLFEDIFLKTIQFQGILKLFHLQTRSYAAHKASDKTGEALSDKFDLFFEVYSGKFQRLKPINSPIMIKTVSNEEMVQIAKRYVAYLFVSTQTLCKKDSNRELCNVLDEMVAIVQKFIYLMGLK